MSLQASEASSDSFLPPVQLVDSIEGAAVAGAVDALLVTQQNADRAGIAGPAQGWGPWAAALSAAAQGQLEAAPADDSIGIDFASSSL